jgi:hypothetical protein
VGLGSRDLVTRSLERNSERQSGERATYKPFGTTPTPRPSDETLRHF